LPISEPSIEESQKEVCRGIAAEFRPSPGRSMCGFAHSTDGQRPVNGLRHPSGEDTTGWFLWCGEIFSTDADFFQPECTSHIYEKCPEIAKFLGLPPGDRFLVAGEHVDVWFDASLLDI
jgi:hypothetical protein